MTIYSFIGVAVTSASVVIFGAPIWDPVALLGRFNQPLIASIALIALLIATLNTNVAANVVSPSNDFSNLNPRLISFRTGGLITGVIGVADDAVEAVQRLQQLYLRMAGGLLGTAGSDCRSDDRRLLHRSEKQAGGRATSIADKATTSTAEDSTTARWPLWLRRGGGAGGARRPSLHWLYDYAWFVGFFVAGGGYVLLMRRRRASASD